MESPSSSRPSGPLVSNESVHSALKHWLDADRQTSQLSSLLLYETARARCATDNEAHRQTLDAAVEALAATHPRDARLLQLRFREGATGREASSVLHLAESTIFTHQREAIARLAAVLAEQEQQLRAMQLTSWERRLEGLASMRLVGLDGQLASLSASLRSPEPPFVMSLEGMGGIGKSTLAEALVRRLVPETTFADLAWVTARQQSFNLGGSIREERRSLLNAQGIAELIFDQLWQSEEQPLALSASHKLEMLRQRLKQAAHLVVVDNLETVADLQVLMPTIRQLANPSQFILTSRESLYGESGVFHHVLRELSQADALELVRQEAQERNLPSLVVAPDKQLIPIYDTVGGNPLALRLVVGQVHVHPLNYVLNGLRGAQGQSALNLYTYVYRRAWDSLDENEQRVLLAMPLIVEQGGGLEDVAAVSGLPLDAVGDGLARLVTMNLVDARGGFDQRRYTIHSLTRTFLHEIAHWG